MEETSLSIFPSSFSGHAFPSFSDHCLAVDEIAIDDTAPTESPLIVSVPCLGNIYMAKWCCEKAMSERATLLELFAS
jgi:hypothetical protein